MLFDEHSMEEINKVITKLNNDFCGKKEFSLTCIESILYDGGKIRFIVHE